MKKLELTRPLCIFDLETTGLDVCKDQIIEIGILKIFPDKSTQYLTYKIKPDVPMHPQASEVLGIYDKDLQGYAPFLSVATEVFTFIQGSDFAGFNSDRFDLPILAEELLRCGLCLDLDNCRTVDVMKIYHSFNKRNLESAYKQYCNKELIDKHSVLADITATAEVLFAQVQQHDIGQTMDSLSEWSNRELNQADFSGHLVFNSNRDLVLNFGKNKGLLVRDLYNRDRGYLDWISRGDFPLYTKSMILKEIKKII